MAGEKRIILFSTETESNQATLRTLRDAGFDITAVSDPSLLMREVRNARDRVVVLDFQSHGIDGLRLLRQIKHLDGSVQVLVINAEPKLFTGIQIFRSGGEACFFAPSPSGAELCQALDAAYEKIARWWKTLRELSSNRAAAEAESPVVAQAAAKEWRPDGRYPHPDQDIEIVIRGMCLKGKAVTASSAGMDLLLMGAETPVLFEGVTIRHHDEATHGVVRRMSKHPSGSWLIGVEWQAPALDPSVAVGAHAERALFVVLHGYHVVARSLVAVNKDWVSARLATGRVHAVPTNAVCALTRSEREAELLTAEDLSFFADFYQLQSLASLGATVQAIMAIEFAAEEGLK